MSLRATAREITYFYYGSGVDFTGCSKSDIAESITSGSYSHMGNMNSEIYSFRALVEQFGVR